LNKDGRARTLGVVISGIDSVAIESGERENGANSGSIGAPETTVSSPVATQDHALDQRCRNADHDQQRLEDL
jgi:hypothetical protein